VRARKEIADMAGIAKNMFTRYRKNVKETALDMEKEVAWFRDAEDYADKMQEELSRFLLETTRHDPAERTQENIHRMLRIVDELEKVTDSCMNLMYLLERRKRKGLQLDAGELTALEPYTAIAEEFLTFVEAHAAEPINEIQLKAASELEDKIDAFRDELRKKARKRLSAGAEVKAELLYIDMVRHIEKIGDYAFSIAEAMREMR